MPQSSRLAPPAAELVQELVIGNRILFDQGVVDGFGHISVRHDGDPSRYLMSRSLAPGLVTADDIEVFDLESELLADRGRLQYAERFIHGEVYKARPDVVAVVHCHAPQLIPFGATKAALQPIYHMSGFLGGGVARFEIRDTGGMTDMLVRTPALGRALALSLAEKPIVLMRGHGATVVGISIKQVVYRSIYAALNAGLQMEAMRLGEVSYLAREEAMKAGDTNTKALERPWAIWAQAAMAGKPGA